MKKVYQKPKISFESFQMNTSIASNCEVKLKDDELYLEGLGYAFTGEHGCEYKVTIQTGNEDYNGICYHVCNRGN